MRTLDRSREFGTVTPPHESPEFDRPIYFEQDGTCFDAHGGEVIAGQSRSTTHLAPGEIETAAAPTFTHPTDAMAVSFTPHELLAQANTLPWPLFGKEARRILGKICPAGKQAMITALEQVTADYDARLARRGSRGRPQPASAAPEPAPVADMPSAGPPAEPAPQPAAVAPSRPPAPQGTPAVVAATAATTSGVPSGVDLKAWARGTKNYMFAEVAKTIRAQYHRVIDTSSPNATRDAVDFLIGANVVTAAEARRA